MVPMNLLTPYHYLISASSALKIWDRPLYNWGEGEGEGGWAIKKIAASAVLILFFTQLCCKMTKLSIRLRT